MSEKIYCGSGKVFGQYGGIGGSICLSDIPNEFITTGKNNKMYFNYKLSERREADQYGNTHSMEVDTFKPKEKYNNKAGTPLSETIKPPIQPGFNPNGVDDDIAF